MNTAVKVVVIVLGMLALVIVLSLIMAYPTMWVMNYLFAPPLLMKVFWVSQMTFWKAFWLNAFCGLLIKGSSSSSSSKN